MSDFLVLIPARFGSQRFPGKPLAKIMGKPMIGYVIDNCLKSGFDYCVVTDNDDIESYIKSINGDVVRVDDDVSTGTQRIALAYERFFSDKNYQFILNVQGDEPLLTGEDIKKIGHAHKASKMGAYTGVKKRSSQEDQQIYLNPNTVKCAFSEKAAKCLYFSRSPIPFVRDNIEFDWFQHIGVYSYTTQTLGSFSTLAESKLESYEKLEQLRLLENGISMGAVVLEMDLHGVDAPEDIRIIEKALSE